MSITQRTQGKRIDLMAPAVGRGPLGGLLAALGAGLRSLGQMRAGATMIEAAPAVPAGMSECFARAMCENSNSAMSWLYYATQLTNPGERRYCISRALQIDPESEVIRSEARRIGRG